MACECNVVEASLHAWLAESAVSAWGLALSGRTPDSVSVGKKTSRQQSHPTKNYFYHIFNN